VATGWAAPVDLKCIKVVKHLVSSHTEMSSARDQQPRGFPTVPNSLDAGSHEVHDFYPRYAPPASTTPYYTPYLGLRARLSQVWINRWTILLALIICRLLLAVNDINYDMKVAKQQALSSCTSVENVGSAMASMPHYLSDGVNAMAADGITNAINGLMQMLLLTVTGVEELVIFVINMMTSTYTCLITLAITGSLEVAIQMIEDVGNFMNETIQGITGDISGALSDFESGLNSFLSDINIGGIFGSSSGPPTIDLSSEIDKLNSITIDPSTMDSDLSKLNASLPSFAQVQNFTDSIISFPFEQVKQLINSSIDTYTFDKSIFPQADKQSLTFCSDNPAIDNFFDGLTDTIQTTRKVFIIVLTILAVLACVPMAYVEIWRWRSTQQRALLVQTQAYDPMDVIYIASRTYTTTIGVKLASRFKSPKNQILVRWLVAYATSLPALFVLALALAGLLSCLCQWILLREIQKEVPVLADQVGDFANTVVSALNNASTAWAFSANSVINSTNDKVNGDVFGWVNTTTSAINNTLNEFTNDMTTALNETFGGTILYGPITGVFNCLIGLKIASFEKGLTWVSENAHITFPEFNPDVFSLGAAASIANSSSADSFLSSPGDVASDDITNAVVQVTDMLASGIRTEAIISTCVLGLWFLVLLIGLVRVCYASMSREKTRAEGGPMGYTGDNQNFAARRGPAVSEPTQFDRPPSSVPRTSSDGPARAWDPTETYANPVTYATPAAYTTPGAFPENEKMERRGHVSMAPSYHAEAEDFTMHGANEKR
jgi:hypothetical protein